MATFAINFHCMRTSLIFFLLLASYFLCAQIPDLERNLNITSIAADGASYQEFRIPALTGEDDGTLELVVTGADGGRASNPYEDDGCIGKGGDGAQAEGTFPVSDEGDALRPGGVIRFILGVRGLSSEDPDYDKIGGGGGGGTAILYTEATVPGSVPVTNISEDFADADTHWIILLVAGGGGGGSANPSITCTSSDGRGGNDAGIGRCGRGSDSGCSIGLGLGGESVSWDDDDFVSNGGGGAYGAGEGRGGYAGPAATSEGAVANYWYNRTGTAYGFGFGAGGQHLNENHTLDMGIGSGGGGYSGGGGGALESFEPQGGGGGGSFVHPLAYDAELTDRGSSSDIADGEATFRFLDGEYRPTLRCESSEFISFAYDDLGYVILTPEDYEIDNVDGFPSTLSQDSFTLSDLGTTLVTLDYVTDEGIFNCPMTVTVTRVINDLPLLTDKQTVELGFTGEAVDYLIPFDFPYRFVRCNLLGGDGGKSEFGSINGTQRVAYGGAGMLLSCTFAVGTGPGEIAPGSILRSVVGEQGESDGTLFTGFPGAGGGGSALLTLPAGSTEWEILAVAGGGGGGWATTANTYQGHGGALTERGTDDEGNEIGSVTGIVGESVNNGAGALDGPEGLWWQLDSEGADQGYPNGGRGAATSSEGTAAGGWGFGGGGCGGADAGGGGGYSGGAEGGEGIGAGGGGGSFVHPNATGVEFRTPSQVLNSRDGYVNFQATSSSTNPAPTIANCVDQTVYINEAGEIGTFLVYNLVDDATRNQRRSGVAPLIGVDDEEYGGAFNYDCSFLGDYPLTVYVAFPGEIATSCSATLSVLDTVSPVVTVANTGITLSLGADGTASLTAIDHTALDNCTGTTSMISDNTFDHSDIGPQSVTLTVSDDNGNFTVVNVPVTVRDGQSPTLVLRDLDWNYCSLSATDQINGAAFDDGSYDNAPITFADIDLSTLTPVNDRVAVTVVVTDLQGDEYTATAYINLSRDIVLSTQSEVDAFPTTYFSCSELVGNLTIVSGATDRITDLSPLAGLTHIDGDLTLRSNEGLSSLTGLDDLQAVTGELSISQYSSLSNLDALSSLTSLGSLRLDALLSLESAQGLTGIDSVFGDLTLVDVPGLTNGINWPNLTYVGGDLTLDNSSGTNSLGDYGGLTSLAGSLRISAHNNLTDNLSAFSGLTGLSSLTIDGNESFTSAADLTALTDLDTLRLSGNSALTAIDGFTGITILDALIITDNAQLSALNGFSGLVDVASITIKENDQLTSLVGIGNVPAATIESLTIKDNATLSFCNLTNICEYLNTQNPRDITGNSGDCGDAARVAIACSGPSVCPSGDLVFTEQSELDDFVLDYFGCTEVTGNLTISGSGITDLQPLAALLSIQGNLEIRGTSVTSLAGLNDLRSIGNNFELINNGQLIDIDGINRLSSVGQDLYFNRNSAMTSIAGFNTLNSVNALYLNDNDGLIDISGFNALSDVRESIEIVFSEALEDISGFNNLTDYGGINPIQIYQNPALEAITGFNQLASAIGLYLIDNASLSSLSGLSNLLELGSSGIRLRTLPALTNLDGLGGLRVIQGELNLSRLPLLTSLAAFNSLAGDQITRLIITNNPQLALCHAAPVCEALAAGASSVINGNSGYCNSATDIAFLCACDDPVAMVSTGEELAEEHCVVDDWTYYRGNSGLLFAISWNDASANQAASAAARVTINQAGGPAISGGGEEEGAIIGMSYYWNVDIGENTLVVPVDIRFYYPTAALDVLNSFSSTDVDNGISWIKTQGTPYSAETVTVDRLVGVTELTVAASGTQFGQSYKEFHGLTSFSGGTAVRTFGSTVLPIELVNFVGRVDGKTNILQWQTSQEINFSHFALERRADDSQAWVTIAEIEGADAGAVEGQRSYAWTDEVPLPAAYYRLRSVDLDGTFSLSDVIYLERASAEELRVYPNPTTGRLTIDLPTEDHITIGLYDLNGKLLQSAVAAGGRLEQRLNVPAGVYLLVVTSAGERWTSRVVVR